MKKKYAVITLIGLITSCKSNTFNDEYLNIEHRGIKDISITELKADTIVIDASETSLEGKWILHNDKLFFADYNLVGTREYDLDGNFIKRHITSGRGPNEWVSPFVSVSFDNMGNLITIDRNWIFNLFDSSDNKVIRPYPFLSDMKFTNGDWSELLNKPDVNKIQMYQFNLDSRAMKFLNDKLVIPIVTEHVRYNGYDISSNAKKFWRDSYNFIFIDVKNRKTEYLFGHYPRIYSIRNIPSFSSYSFDVSDDQLICSFAADSLIYVRNKTGELIYSFGYDSGDIDYAYPETVNFNDFSESFKEHKKTYAHYLDIKVVGSYCFRGYKLKDDTGYGLQIYRNNNLVGLIKMEDKLSILGYANEVFYGALPIDLEGDCFKLIRFRL